MKKNIKFVYQDVCESMVALKAFINLRDSRPEFDLMKEKGAVGFPCIVVNDGEKIIVGYNEEALGEL